MKTSVPVYLNPGVADGRTDYARTHYVGIAGRGEDAPTLPANHRRAGIFGYNRKTRIQDITDGTSNTMMTSEASNEFGAWGAGGEPTIRAFTKKPILTGPMASAALIAGDVTSALATDRSDLYLRTSTRECWKPSRQWLGARSSVGSDWPRPVAAVRIGSGRG